MRQLKAWGGDLARAVVIAFVTVLWSIGAGEYMQPDRKIDELGVTLLVTAAAALVLRRRLPLVTLAVVTGTLSAFLVLGYPYGPSLLAFLLAVYTVARHRPMRTSVPASAVALLVLSAHGFGDGGLGLVGLVPATAWAVVPFAVGVTVRITAESLERNRAEAIRQRVDDERIRMAQEVHDIVGHGVAAIKMQADVALHVLARKPEQAEAALRAISNTSAQALDELRATLAVVRRPAAEAERTPAPGLGQLPELCERMSDAGVTVWLETSGPPRPVPDRVGLVAYRVVQEALTNVLKHSGASTATVRVRYVGEQLVLQIDNPGVAADPPGEGLGIPGMRGRVEDLGGTFTAGPVPAGRFRVRATLPTGDGRPA